ncbi:DNA repair-scaffolding protein isoform X2 [Pangasianodon hypophthalmus]|uniref:DNA repair-scaffolding protein isoform X2 n=1 Tax=Pangasianodon hypophthalmus TaxID=310915 RepID=UPI002307F6D8|nr:DNA repair-scaffolding protein isoform X2 [Pangasianodon hypophthalmus]
MPSFSKRKRSTRDMRCVLFPEDVRETFSRRGTCETSKATKSSWDRCGDSFLDTPVMEKHNTTRRMSRAVQQLAQTSTSVRPVSGDEDPVHIAWTSSEDEQSDSERQLQPALTITKATRTSRPTVSASSRYGRFLSTGADTDELPTIDSESEHEDTSASKEQISEVAAEISDCSSDSDGDLNPSRLDALAQEPAEQRQRSISEWVRSAQALLQTPPKQTDKPAKTPEDSGKKKRKFESRGFAERLNRLQCRQRSAISFWRHQLVSGNTTGTEERPGVLVLHVQNVWDVCGMQAALCERHPEKETCVALFSKETATQLAPSAGDTIHVYPPWCCLLVQDVYGMFSEVEMQYASSEEELKDITEQLQGKVCLLQGPKVIQRLTRERCAQLFSLIDSLWPPAVPLRVPGEGSCSQTVKVAAPSFCYRLAGQRDSVLPKCESPLYRLPLIQTLREILQDEPASRRCSFKGTLVYKRGQDKEEKDLLLFVTDSSLQDEQNSGSISRTLPVYVSSMFLLQTSVRQAITALSPQFRPRLIFTDAVIEQGKIIISGQSVVQLDSEPSQHENISPPQSVLLDQLSPESPPCSLCTVTGVVMDIDENSAFSWPACSQCGDDSLEALEDKPDVFSCVACGVVDKPSRKMQLEVFLSCPSSSHWTVKVKLQQNSIMSLLNSTGHAEGYEVEAVLGKTVGPLNAFIHVVTHSSALWMGLEEITL